MSNPTAADIQIHASLIEHYLYTEDAPIAPGPLNRFVSVFDGSVSHLLTVDSSGKMLHFMPEATSQSGWRKTAVPVPTPPGADEMFSITAFFARGVLNAIVLFEVPGGYATTWMTRTGAGQWSQANVTFEVSSLLSVVSQLNSYTDSTGNAFVYGLVTSCLGDLPAQAGTPYVNATQFFILFFDQTKNVWDIVYQESFKTMTNMDAPTETKFHIISSNQNPNFNNRVVWITESSLILAGAGLDPDRGGFSLEASTGWQQVDIAGITVQRILPLPRQSFPDCVLLLDSQGTVFVVYPQRGSEQKTVINAANGPSSISAITVSEIAGASSYVALFAIEDGTNSLWIARQNVEDGTPTFANWANLGNNVEAVTAPELVHGGAEVYFAGPELNVYHLAQNPTDMIWATQKLAAPVESNSTPQKVSAVMMHMTVVDSNGNPMPSAPISVASDQWANIVVDELSYLPGPDAAVSIQADATGNADIFFHATSLAMPIFMLSSGSAQNSCQGDVVFHTTTPVSPSSIANRLAGNDPKHPIDSTTLQNAKLLAPNTDPTASIQAINQLGQAMLKKSGSAGAALDLSSITVPHWRIDFTDSGAKFRVLTEAEAKAFRESLPPAGRPEMPGNIFSDIFGDIVNFFTHALEKLESVTVSVVGDALNVMLNGVNFVVTTARQIAAAVQMIFAKIAQGLTDIYTIIKEVIEFLEMLFHWEDILNTHRVFKVCVNSFLNEAYNSVEAVKPLVNQEISQLQQNLATAITGLQKQFGSQTFNEYVNSLPPPSNPGVASGSNVLYGQSMRDHYHQNLSRCQYVFGKSKNYFTNNPFGLPSLPGAAPIDFSNLIRQVSNAWNGNAFNFNDQAQQIMDFIQGRIKSFSDFFDLGIVDLLQALKDFLDLLLVGAEAIIEAILDVLAAAIKGLQDLINASLDIPVISWLYTLLTGDELTILDLFCLAFAVPVTILYKLIRGSAPFSSSDAGSLEQNGLPWLAIPGSAQPGSLLRLQAVPPKVWEALGICGGIVYPLLGWWLAYAADFLLIFGFTEALGPLRSFIILSAGIGAAIGRVLVAPWTLWLTPPSRWSTAEKMRTVLWGGTAMAVLTNLIATFATCVLGVDLSVVGPIMDTGVGLELLYYGVAVVYVEIVEKKYSPWVMVNTVMPLFARPFRCLIAVAKDADDITKALCYAGLAAVDDYVGMGAGVTQLGAGVAGSERGDTFLSAVGSF